MHPSPQSSTPAIVWHRPLCTLLIAAQLALVLQPLSAAAQGKDGGAASNPVAQAQMRRLVALDQQMQAGRARIERERREAAHPAERASRELARVQEIVRELHPEQLTLGRLTLDAQRRAELQAELRQLLAGQGAAQQAQRAEFAATKAQLQNKGLPAQILDRHDQAVVQFEQRAAQFNQLSQGLSQGQAASEAASLQALNRFFEQYPSIKPQPASDPKELPWGSPKPVTRPPAETKAAWYLNQSKSQRIELAQAGGVNIGGLSFASLPEPGQAPEAADLAGAEETALTPDIRAKAQELGHNPVAIANWVRNTIVWQPTWGSIQGAQGTLQSGRGNAFDISSLTIALLRASGVPARYQFGTVDIPAAAAMNWVGGVSKPEAALSLLGQGGVIQTIRMEHVWVKAYVNWSPSRGSKDGGAATRPQTLDASGKVQHPSPHPALNAWVPLDASYKQYSQNAGMDLKSAVPLDANALLSAAQQGATVNAAQGWVQNLNQANLQAQLSDYQSRLSAYINSSPTGASTTVGDVLGQRSIKTQVFNLLPENLPYATVVRANEAAQVPSSMVWKLKLALYQSSSELFNDLPSMSVEQPMFKLNDQRIAISYEPATATDQAVVDAAYQNGQTSFAGYLTRYIPKIRLGFETLGQGYAQQPGMDGRLRVVTLGPGAEYVRDLQLVSGDVSVLSLNTTGVSYKQYQDRVTTHAMTQLDTTQYGLRGLAEEMLHQLGLSWWVHKQVMQENNASLMNVVYHTLPGHALMLAPASVSYYFGVPGAVTYKSRGIDSKLDIFLIEHASMDSATRREYMRISGKYASYMEGGIFDEAFNAYAPLGVSAISLLGKAATDGMKIFHLKPGDEASVSLLGVRADLKNRFLQALNNGFHVTVPEQPVTLGAYVGSGYIIEDPSDGSAAYEINGGQNGGDSPAMHNVAPIPQIPDSTAVGLIVGRQLREAKAMLAVQNGMIVGVVMPAVPVAAGALAALMMMVSLLALMAKDLAQTIKDGIQTRTWRKYTRHQEFIMKHRWIYASDTGTFGGGGVYVADADAERLRGVNCLSFDPVDVVTRFQIPNPVKPDPNEITGFVDVIERFKGYFGVSPKGPNSAGQMEYLIYRPLVLVPDLKPNAAPGSLAWAIALDRLRVLSDIVEVCER